MKKPLLYILPFLLLSSLAWAENQLPECEGTDYRQWTNCQGTWNENNILTYMTWANGQKYVGEWKDGKEHGQGYSILGWQNDGCDGEFRDGDYIPGSGVCWH